MIEAKEWFLKLKSDGKPVVIICGDGFLPTKFLVPCDEDVTILQDGIVVKDRKNEYLCRYNRLKYENPPTPIAMLERVGTISKTEEHILYMMYEIVSGVAIEHSPVVVKKIPFNLESILEKYKKYESRVKGIDFQAVIQEIPV